MNGLRAAAAELGKLNRLIAKEKPRCEVLICPPATLIADFHTRAKGMAVKIGAQDCHPAPSGAHTGDLSADMLKDAGAAYVIVGHSERRADHHETDALVRAKAEAAHRAGLAAIICVGETQAERDAGQTLGVISAQLKGSVPKGATAKGLVVAYEPVWAIGTGRTPTLEEVEQVHGFIRRELTKRFKAEGRAMRLLYGGSVKPGNAAELMAVDHVDGALVGGASLKAADFYGIISVYR